MVLLLTQEELLSTCMNHENIKNIVTIIGYNWHVPLPLMSFISCSAAEACCQVAQSQYTPGFVR